MLINLIPYSIHPPFFEGFFYKIFKVLYLKPLSLLSWSYTMKLTELSFLFLLFASMAKSQIYKKVYITPNILNQVANRAILVHSANLALCTAICSDFGR